MTRDLARALDEELAERTPPTAITRELIIHRGRKVRRRRRLAFGGGGILTGVAVVAALALLVPGLVPGQRTDAAEDPPSTLVQQEFPLPPMDPDEHYQWVPYSGEIRETEETRTLDAAYRQYIASLGEIDTTGADPIQRLGRSIELVVLDDLSGDNKVIDYAAPVYAGGGIELLSADGGHADTVHVQASAKGSFLEGTGQPVGSNPNAPAPYLVPGCADYRFNRGVGGVSLEVDFECGESTGPNGEKVLTVTHRKTTDDGELRSSRRYVVVYRLDGTALTVTDDLVDRDDEIADLRGVEFRLSEQDLIDFALAMPDVLVR